MAKGIESLISLSDQNHKILMSNRIVVFVIHVILYHLLKLPMELMPNYSFFNRIRGKVIGLFCASCGKNFMVASGCTLNMIRRMSVGDDVYIAHNVWINATGGLELADEVIISPGCVIATTKHKYADGRVRLRESENAAVSIGVGSWIASNSVVTMGVSVGRGVIVGACSVVISNLDSFCLYAGNPAVKVKSLG